VNRLTQSEVTATKINHRGRRRKHWAASYRRFRESWSIFSQNKIAVLGLIILIIFAAFPIVHVILRSTAWEAKKYDPVYGFDMDSAPHPAPPSWIPAEILAEDNVHRFDRNRPSFEHILGTDILGRDVLGILMASTVTTFLVGISAALTTAVIGLSIASISSYYRGWVDGLLTHVSDAFLLLPAPIFMIAVGVYLQSKRTIFSEIAYLAINGEPLSSGLKRILQPIEFGIIYGIIAGAGGAAIVLRSHGLKTMALSFVEASRVSGARASHIIFRHLVPHMIPLAGVYMLVVVTGAVVASGFLSFFGLNPNPLNWGTMIYNAFTYQGVSFEIPWWALMAPAMAISIFAAAFYMISRGIHEVVEPRLREEPVAQDRREETPGPGIRWHFGGRALEIILLFLIIIAVILGGAALYLVFSRSF
jgi:peptide/nickel transport system permease protein